MVQVWKKCVVNRELIEWWSEKCMIIIIIQIKKIAWSSNTGLIQRHQIVLERRNTKFKTLDISVKKWSDPEHCHAIEEGKNRKQVSRSVTENFEEIKKCTRAMVSNLFGIRDRYCGRQFSHQGKGNGLGMIQVHYSHCVLYFYYYYISLT